MRSIRGILLDVDGTLVDSNDAHALAWVRALAESGFAITFEMVRPCIGMGGDKLLPEVVRIDVESPEGKKISDRRGEIFLSEFLPHLLPCRGAKALLELLHERSFRLGVASSAKEEELKPLLRICGADRLIENATSSDDAENSKPDPDILQASLKKLGMKPEEAVMIGDTPYDVEAAKRASIRIIALRCGGWNDRDLGSADAIYNDPEDLAQHIDESMLAL